MVSLCIGARGAYDANSLHLPVKCADALEFSIQIEQEVPIKPDSRYLQCVQDLHSLCFGISALFFDNLNFSISSTKILRITFDTFAVKSRLVVFFSLRNDSISQVASQLFGRMPTLLLGGAARVKP
jgi:hypothetical protein